MADSPTLYRLFTDEDAPSGVTPEGTTASRTKLTRVTSRSLTELLREGKVWRASGDFRLDGGIGARSAHGHLFGIPDIDSHLRMEPGAVHEFFSSYRASASVEPRSGAGEPSACIEHVPPVTLLSVLAANLLRTIPPRTRPPGPNILWIGRRCWPNPYFLKRFEVPQARGGAKTLLEHSLFIDPPTPELMRWAVLTALRSPALALVIADASKMQATHLKRLVLGAKGSGTSGFLVRDSRFLRTPSLSDARWHVQPCRSVPLAGTGAALDSGTRWELDLMKVRGPRPARHTWIIELFDPLLRTSERLLEEITGHSATSSRAHEKLSLHIPPDVVGGSGEEAEDSVAAALHRYSARRCSA